MKYTKELMRSIAHMQIDSISKRGANTYNSAIVECCFGMAVLLSETEYNDVEFKYLLDLKFQWLQDMPDIRQAILEWCYIFRDLA